MNHCFAKSPFILAIVLSTGISATLFSQPRQDSVTYQAYDDLMGLENTELYNGPEYASPHGASWDGSHVYLKSPIFTPGDLVYGGQPYSKVLMTYDLLTDNVIVRSNDGLSTFKIRMIPGHLSRFSLHGRAFVRLTDTDLALEGHHFFEVAFVREKVALFVKHAKKIKRETVDGVLQHRFIPSNYYLLKYQGIFHVVHSTRDFKQICPDRYEDIRSLRKEYRAAHKENPDRLMLMIAEYLAADTT